MAASDCNHAFRTMHRCQSESCNKGFIQEIYLCLGLCTGSQLLDIRGNLSIIVLQKLLTDRGKENFPAPTALQKVGWFDRIGKERKKPTAFADKQRGREIFLGKFREIFLFREGEGRMTKKTYQDL